MIPPIDLIAAAAVLFDVSDGAIVAKTRGNTRLNKARQAVAWVMRQHDYTLMEIAAILKRDHTTIIYAVRHVDALTADPVFAAKLRALLAASEAAPPTVQQTVAARTYTITAPLRLAVAFWGVAMPLTA